MSDFKTFHGERLKALGISVTMSAGKYATLRVGDVALALKPALAEKAALELEKWLKAHVLRELRACDHHVTCYLMKARITELEKL